MNTQRAGNILYFRFFGASGMLIKEHGKLGAVAQLQLLENTAEIVADGTFAEKELCSNFFVAEPLRYQSDDLVFL